MSNWLSCFPLSLERIRELRDNSPIRIKNYKNTVKIRNKNHIDKVYKKVSKDIGLFSKRDLFIAGMFLYWGEGTKTQEAMVTLTNTNPAMLKLYIKWLGLFNVRRKDLKVKLHLYSDMNINESVIFWSKELRIPINQFCKPYIKKSSLKSISYKKGFGKGTCSVIFGSKPLWEYIMFGLKYIGEVCNKEPRP
ncbi:MAG TPA: hypothetical protein VFQ59_02150 [Candidatus Paceibacterota bacterium]|nr:hypothetical protein [Candidatus Paceibacterota bacterium]